MNESSWIIPTISSLMAAGFITCGILAFRAIFKFMDWRAGDQESLWNFLALCCGSSSGLFFGIALINFFIPFPVSIFEFIVNMGYFTALAGLGLTFYSVFMKWWRQK
ncbi:MAG: hypothetical protein ACTSRS_11000 [Candidatus Helarchaeota archaeon]